MEELFPWTYFLVSLLTSFGTLWFISTFPGFLSPSLKKVKKATMPEYFFFSTGLILIFLAIANQNMEWPANVVCYFFFLLMAICVWTDMKQGIIPNRLIAAGAAGWFLFSKFYGFHGFDAVWAAVALSVGMMAINLVTFWILEKETFGMGDVKLLFIIGLFSGWEGFWFLYLSIFIGALIALTGMAFHKIERKTQLPFAPFLAAGCMIGIFILPWVQFLGWLYAF